MNHKTSLESRADAIVEAFGRTDDWEMLPLDIVKLGEQLRDEGRSSERARYINPGFAAREHEALIAIAEAAGKYHRECGHENEGAAAECDHICDAWKVWRALYTIHATAGNPFASAPPATEPTPNPADRPKGGL